MNKCSESLVYNLDYNFISDLSDLNKAVKIKITVSMFLTIDL